MWSRLRPVWIQFLLGFLPPPSPFRLLHHLGCTQSGHIFLSWLCLLTPCLLVQAYPRKGGVVLLHLLGPHEELQEFLILQWNLQTTNAMLYGPIPLLFLRWLVDPGTCPYLINSYDTCDNFTAKHQSFLAAVQTEVELIRFSDTYC